MVQMHFKANASFSFPHIPLSPIPRNVNIKITKTRKEKKKLKRKRKVFPFSDERLQTSSDDQNDQFFNGRNSKNWQGVIMMPAAAFMSETELIW